MSKIITVYGIFILLLSSCSVSKYNFDRLTYYNGNFSPHPELRYLIDISIIDSISTVKYSIGESYNNLTTILTENQRADISNSLKKLPNHNSSKQLIKEIPTNGLQLFMNDSMVYFNIWNNSYRTNKRVVNFEKKIKKLLLPLDSIICSQ
jgi:hypothetical protein